MGNKDDLDKLIRTKDAARDRNCYLLLYSSYESMTSDSKWCWCWHPSRSAPLRSKRALEWKSSPGIFTSRSCCYTASWNHQVVIQHTKTVTSCYKSGTQHDLYESPAMVHKLYSIILGSMLRIYSFPFSLANMYIESGDDLIWRWSI